MRIDWQIDAPLSLEPEVTRHMQIAADRCAAEEGIPFPCAISVRLCDDGAIRKINASLRQADRATDVLSFPTVRYAAGKTARNSLKAIRREFDDETGAWFLGDIIISVDHMNAQAAEYGHSPGREAAYLLVHGICHLMGYDHLEEGERIQMRVIEERILSSVNINREGETPVNDQTLMELARNAMERSYSPYSRFPVGAALLASDGRVFQGCNIENASFGLTNCAERTAVFKAVSEGATSFETIAIAALKPAWPCGACRQVLREFAPDLRVIITWGNGKSAEKKLTELLPDSFGPTDLMEETGEMTHE